MVGFAGSAEPAPGNDGALLEVVFEWISTHRGWDFIASPTKCFYAPLFYAGLISWWTLFLSITSSLPSEDRSGFVPCVFRMITGRQCPFCGMTRAFICIGHLEFRRAIHFHPASLLVYPFFIWLALASFWKAAIGEYDEWPFLPQWIQWIWICLCAPIFMRVWWTRIILPILETQEKDTPNVEDPQKKEA